MIATWRDVLNCCNFLREKEWKNDFLWFTFSPTLDRKTKISEKIAAAKGTTTDWTKKSLQIFITASSNIVETKAKEGNVHRNKHQKKGVKHFVSKFNHFTKFVILYLEVCQAHWGSSLESTPMTRRVGENIRNPNPCQGLNVPRLKLSNSAPARIPAAAMMKRRQNTA